MRNVLRANDIKTGNIMLPADGCHIFFNAKMENC